MPRPHRDTKIEAVVFGSESESRLPGRCRRIGGWRAQAPGDAMIIESFMISHARSHGSVPLEAIADSQHRRQVSDMEVGA